MLGGKKYAPPLLLDPTDQISRRRRRRRKGIISSKPMRVEGEEEEEEDQGGLEKEEEEDGVELLREGPHLEQLREIFQRFDMDSDGSLTQLELAALLRSLGLKPTGDQLCALLADMDSNANGSVEFEELVCAIAPVMSERALLDQQLLLDVFRSFDRDGNGVITAPELARSMAKMGHPLTFLELNQMMREADSDGDGVISFHEFASIMAKSAIEFLGLPPLHSLLT